MKYTFRKCEDTDIHFIYELKEKCFKWYIEKIDFKNGTIQEICENKQKKR